MKIKNSLTGASSTESLFTDHQSLNVRVPPRWAIDISDRGDVVGYAGTEEGEEGTDFCGSSREGFEDMTIGFGFKESVV